MTKTILVLTTTANVEDARKIARVLLEQNLAGCVQINGPIESTYWWEGALETATEWQCVAKTTLELFSRIEQAIVSIHPYQIPEILAVPTEAVGEKYAQWLSTQVHT